MSIPMKWLNGLPFERLPSDLSSHRALVVFAGSSHDEEERVRYETRFSFHREIVLLPTDLRDEGDSVAHHKKSLITWLEEARKRTSAELVHLMVKDAAIPLGIKWALLCPLSFSSLTLIAEHEWQDEQGLFRTFLRPWERKHLPAIVPPCHLVAKGGDRSRALLDLATVKQSDLEGFSSRRGLWEAIFQFQSAYEPSFPVRVYLKLLGDKETTWNDRGHFLNTAAEATQRILVNHARKRQRMRRGGGRKRALLDVGDLAAEEDSSEILALDEALRRLERQDERMSQVVKLRFFAGLSIEETARTLGLSPRTVKREWTCARAWLYKELEGKRVVSKGNPVDSTTWKRVKEIFSDALEKPTPDRCAFLDEQCKGDAQLRVQVDALLAAHTEGHDFMASPTQGAFSVRDWKACAPNKNPKSPVPD